MGFEEIVATVADDDPVQVSKAGNRFRLLLQRRPNVEIAAEK